MYIAYLPPDVIGEIASFSHAMAIGNLWCCGCRLLNRKLMPLDSMRTYDLRGGLKPVKRVPRFVYQLRGLKQIHLNFCDSEKVQSPALIPSDFFSHFGTLEVRTISVHSRGLLEGWFTPAGMRHIAVRYRFPRLDALKLSACESTSLESLKTFLRSLPSSLRSLSIVVVSTSRFEISIEHLNLPSSLQELSFGVGKVPSLDFVFHLPLLRKLALPKMRSATYCAQTAKPLVHLERLELPTLDKIEPTSNEDHHGLFEFLNLLPHIDQLVSNMNALKWESSPNWFKIRHFSIQKSGHLYTAPIAKFPAGVAFIQVKGILSDDNGALAHFFNLTSLDVHMYIRFSHFVFPGSITHLACEWRDEFENELRFLPPSLVRVTRRPSQSLASAPIELLPDTLSSIILPADLGLNAKKIIKNWKGPTWINAHLALETDDEYLFDTIWNYFKPTSAQLITNLALKAAQRKCHNILATLLSKDTFWAAIRTVSNLDQSDLLCWAPIPAFSRLYQGGLRFEYFPVSRVTKECKSDSVVFLEMLFDDMALRTQANKRFSFSAAIYAKSIKCARWLIENELYECDYQEITRMSVAKRDIGFLNMLLDLGLHDPPEAYITLIHMDYISKILPMDISRLKGLDIEYSIQFLDWAASFGIAGSILTAKTTNAIIRCYRDLPQDISHSVEPLFLETFSWLQAHNFPFSTYVEETSLPAKESQHSNVLGLPKALGFSYNSCVLI